MRTPVVNAVLVAAGSGVRLGAGVPKALVELAGRPLVWHAVGALIAGGCERVVVVVPPSQVGDFRSAVLDYPQARLVAGGARRQDSVRAGLTALAPDPDTIVLVHDAARPLVPESVVRRVAEAVAAGAAAVVPVVAVTDSIRQVGDSGSSVAVERAALRAVQTPQGFRADVLVGAHVLVAERGVEVSDDASAAELAGAAVTLVTGDAEAMKITEPLDLVVAHEILKRRA